MGAYELTVQPGQFRLCIQGFGFLDPCLWGGAQSVAVGSASAAAIALQAQRGGQFLLRVHDLLGLLATAEALPGQAVSAFVATPSGLKIILPVVYNDGQIRDYGLLTPLNVPLTVTVANSRVSLVNPSGAPVTAQAIAFQVMPLAPLPTDPIQLALARKFPPPQATFVHVYTVSATGTSLR
jgi:hypothetical protein